MTADKWVNKLLAATDQLELFPEIGAPVEEVGCSAFRELVVGPYRIIYRVVGDECRIGAIVRAERDLTRALSPDDLP